MTFCFKGMLIFSSAVRRNDILDDMVARIADKPRFGIDVISATTARITGDPALTVTLRFNSELDMDDLAARIEAFATGPRTPQPGSWYTLHPCPHDETNNTPCVITTRRDW